MIDFEQAVRDQADLRALIESTTDDLLGEPFKFNDSYGFASILKTYAGYPADRPVHAVIPHGVYLDAGLMLEVERDSGLPAVLNYPAFRAEAWRGRADVSVIPSASPFLYALALFRERFSPRADAQGTLFFAAHTVQTLRTNTDWRSVVDELRRLDERFLPVTVCAHPVDYLKGLYDPLEREGFEIVSAGNTFDPEFMFRWLHLLSRHTYAASNDVGGAVLYARRAGAGVFLLDEIAEQYHEPSVYVLNRLHDDSQAKETKRRIVEIFRGDPDTANAERDAVVAYLLGERDFKTPEGLLADLEYAEELSR